MNAFRRVLFLSVLLGCTDGGATPTDFALFSAGDDVDRVVSSVVFDTLWAIGGPSDTLLARPTLPRAYGDGGLVFFDLFDQRLHRVGPSGRVLWSWGRRGEGPGEVQDVQGVDVTAAGNVILVDAERAVRITLSSDGELLTEGPLPQSLGLIRSVALLGDDRLAVQSSREPWGVWDRGSIRPVTGLPAGWSEMPSLQNQGRMAAWREDGWVFGFAFGNGWMAFRDAELIGVHPYVQHHDFPAVVAERRGLTTISRMTERPPSTGRSVSVRGDTLYVLFGGTGAPGNRPGYMLDTYDLATGHYLSTHVLPHYANRAVVDQEGRVFTINNATLYPVIVALAPTMASTRHEEQPR